MTDVLDRVDSPQTTKFLSLEDLRNLPKPKPLVDGLLYADSLAEIYGPPGSYKSFVALSLALSVASGCGGKLHVPEARPVVYVAAEGATGLAARVDAWLAANGVASDVLSSFHVLSQPVQFNNEDLASLASDVIAVDAGLVIFDTRARCTVGMEENSAKDAGEAVAAVETFRAMTQATVLTVHHSAKAGGTARGSSAWSGAVWTELEVKRNARAMTAKVTVAKHKDAESGNSTVFALQPVGDSLAAFPECPQGQFPVHFPVAPPEGLPNGAVVNQLVDAGVSRSRADRLIAGHYRVEGSQKSKRLYERSSG